MSVNLKGVAILNIQSADYHPFTNRIKNFTKNAFVYLQTKSLKSYQLILNEYYTIKDLPLLKYTLKVIKTD